MVAGKTLPTGVEGLDQILKGGLPGPHLYLVQGGPGTGKTTLGLKFLLANRTAGLRTMYVSLSQSRDELEQIVLSHGWTLEGVVVEDLKLSHVLEDVGYQTILHTADLELGLTRKAIQDALARHRPDCLVYDSLLEVRHLSKEDVQYRRELLGFKAFLSERSIATLLIDNEVAGAGDVEVEAIVHGIVRLDKTLPEYGIARRRVEVRKMRGVAVADGYHDMAIRTGVGIEVYPRVVPDLAVESQERDLIQSGVGALDEMLGGGLEPGTTSLIVGQAGTGKSTLATLYAQAALKRGERVATFLFEERKETFFRRTEGLGMPMRAQVESGQLGIHDFSPAEIPPGAFSLLVQDEVDRKGARVIVIDSFTGYLSALPEERQAVMQIQSLLKYVARRGALSLLIVAQPGLLGHHIDKADVDVSFLGDSALLLRMSEEPGVIRRTITVVKKRHGPHGLDVRELIIGPKLVTISPLPSETLKRDAG